MNQAVRWEDAVSSYDTVYLIAKGYYTEKRDRPDAASSWGDYITSYYQDQRFTLGSGLLTNGYANPRGANADWCDECGVNSGVRSTAPAIPDGWLPACARLRSRHRQHHAPDDQRRHAV